MHAYLIMAHSNYNQLLKLLKSIDDLRNEIFLHLDLKFQLSEEQIKVLKGYMHFSKLHLIKRQSISWGGYSQIKAEIELIKAAVDSDTEFLYIHLISGSDLPIKSQDYIHSFFDKYNGEEFVEFMNVDWSNRNLRRLKYYYPLQEVAGKQSQIIKNKMYELQRFFVRLQQLIGINRLKKGELELKCGSNWFSITYECAKFIVDKWPDYCDMFKCTKCADEYLVQTIIANSVFYHNRHIPVISDGNHENMRLIEWVSGSHPKIFRAEDMNRIINTDLLFARKFDDAVDGGVIDQIVEVVKTNENLVLDFR